MTHFQKTGIFLLRSCNLLCLYFLVIFCVSHLIWLFSLLYWVSTSVYSLSWPTPAFLLSSTNLLQSICFLLILIQRLLNIGRFSLVLLHGLCVPVTFPFGMQSSAISFNLWENFSHFFALHIGLVPSSGPSQCQDFFMHW